MPAETAFSRRDFALMALLVLAALGIRLYFLQFYEVISADGVSYLTIAKEFISGRGLSSATHYPPFYPILVGLASTLTANFEIAGLVVAVLMGALLAVPVYLLGVEFFDRRVGVIAAILSITWPTLRYWSTAVMSQSTYITLVLFGLYFLWRGYRESALPKSLLAGAFFACAHLTRSEGVLVLVAATGALFLVTFIEARPRRKLLYLLASLGAFLLLFSPYLVMLHEITGKWQLTGKSRVTIADALSQYLGTPDIKHDPSFKGIGYLDLFRLYPDYLRTNYLQNLDTLWRQLLPSYGWFLAGAGLLAGAWNRERLMQRAYLLSSFAPLLVIIVFFFIGPEYTQAYLPVLFLFVGNALTAPAAWLSAQRGEAARSPLLQAAAFAPVALAILFGGWSVLRAIPDVSVPYHYTQDGGRYDDKRIGLRLAQMLPEDAVLITRSGRVGFYSDRTFLMPPQTDYPGLIEYAARNGVDYLIANGDLLGVRPQLSFLFTPILDPKTPYTPPAELELVFQGREPGGSPYIVYRFRSR